MTDLTSILPLTTKTTSLAIQNNS